MKILDSSVIYDNPLPQLRSRQSYFPFGCELQDGTLAATHVIGEAFESVDGTTNISFSTDKGKSWSVPKPLFDKSGYKCPITDYTKVRVLKDGRMIALGYGLLREDPELPVGNPDTGGMLDDILFYAVSEDQGQTWTDMIPIDCFCNRHVEASGPIIELQDGTWLAPIVRYQNWDGTIDEPIRGHALRSEDGGKTWNDASICMEFEGNTVTCYEMRMCQLESGAIVCIGWNEDVVTGERLQNHYTVSYDNGKTWSKPITTGILGQASSVCAIGGEKLLALHAIRRDTDRPGIYAFVVDFSEKTWNIVEEQLLWEPAAPMVRDHKMADIFAFLKFGQPGAILLSDGDVLMTHWYAQDGQYRTVATRIQI